MNDNAFGRWTGASFEDLAGDPAWRRWNEQRGFARPPEGETMLEAQVRVARFIEKACAVHAEERICAVAHADVIKAAIAFAMGLPLAFYGQFDISPASISVIIAGDWGMKVDKINEVTANE